MDQNDSGIVFQNEDQMASLQTGSHTPKMVGLLMKYSGGRITNETQASYILGGIAGFVLFISLVILVVGTKSKQQPLRIDAEGNPTNWEMR